LHGLAQDAAKPLLKAHTIVLEKKRMFSIDGKRERMEQMPRYLAGNAGALQAYKQYKKLDNISTPIGLVMIGSFITTLTQIGKNNTTMIGFGVGTLLSGYIGTRIFNKSQQQLRRATCLYNTALP
jgi:hypothetical protein